MDKTERLQRKKERFRRKMRVMAAVLAVVAIIAAVFLLINLKRIYDSNTGSGSTLSSGSTSSEYSNDYYTIGNNPTSINKTYFKELNTAVEDEDDAAISEALVKCFVSEYYTWTNKDGNYDIGGIQYIFTDRQSDFESYTRNEVYKDMDLYISQLGRDRLMQVASVEVTAAEQTDPFVVYSDDTSSTADTTATADAAATATTETTTSYEAYTVTANWTYETDTDMDLSEAQTNAVFTVINHDGRMEIAAIQ